MRIGVIGAGHVGTALGKGWAKAGHEVVYGSRSGRAAAPHPGSTIDSVRGATASSEVVVLATPWPAAAEALSAAGDLEGKPLLDATNPIGPGFSLALGHTTSGAEHLAALAPSARVVKAFNTTGFENMERPRYGARRAFMPVASDDPGALEVAVRLANDLGFEGVGLPTLARARDLEPLALLWIKLALQWGQGRDFAFALARREPGEAARAPKRTERPRSITVVGSGNIGGALARGWLAAGHRVSIAARDPSSEEVRAIVALGASATPLEGAASDAEVVVFSIPAGAVVGTAALLGDLKDKIVVDCTNAIGKGFTLQHGLTTSSSEELQRALPGAKVVRAFHQQGAETLQGPAFAGHRAASFVSGDDAEARAVVRGLSEDLGLDSLEAGPLASSRLLDPMTLLWVALAKALGTRELALSLLRR